MYRPPPSPSERYTMDLPSCDQSGCQLCPGPLVTCTGSPPLTCCTQMSNFPPRSELYAKKPPSGDQEASICRPSSKVSRVRVRCIDDAGDFIRLKKNTPTAASSKIERNGIERRKIQLRCCTGILLLATGK